ncbi:MAG: cadherin-like beta sandwich domain-containing protein [Clostridia bacterium]|nr:cadherin-like beta sandwich domain-containing protein [Clostridia bacterium]
MKRIGILTKSSIILIIIFATSMFFNRAYAADLAVSASGSNVTISSDLTGRFNISVDGGTASESSVWLESSSKTISISGVGENGATVTVTPATVSDSDGNAKTVSAKSVKIVGSKSTTSRSNTTETQKATTDTQKTTTEKEPSFKAANTTMYSTGNINVRKSYSADSDKLGTLQSGEKVTVTATGDNGWSKISFNGGTGYVKTSLLTKEEPKKSEDKALKSLEITGYEMDPEFDPEITDYSIIVKKEDEKLDIKATPNDEKAKVEITGNENLKDGDNIIKITVTAEDETTRIYTLNATKKEEAKFGLTSLKVDGYSLTPKFSSEVLEYKVTILDPKVNSLKVTGVSSDEDAKIEVTGNTNLKEGNNVITVNVESKDGTQKATYKITVNKSAAGTTTKKKDNKILYAGIGVIAFLLIVIIAIVIKNKRNNEEYDEEEYDEDDENSENPYGYSPKEESQDNYIGRKQNEYNNFEDIEDKKQIEEELFGKIPEPENIRPELESEDLKPEPEVEKPKYEDNFNYNAYNTKDMYEGTQGSQDFYDDDDGYRSRRSKGKHSK